MKKKKIAVIGGGLGSITAVYHIMNQPDAADLYDITLYQTGWRLGGKGASGVNIEKGYRVEEHGIHFWFGFYENGFRLMKDVYAGLGRPPGTPMASFDDAFKGQPTMDFAQEINGQWADWTIDFPTVPGRVGDGNFPTPIEEIFYVAFNWLANEFKKQTGVLSGGCLSLFTRPFTPKQKRPAIHGPLEPVLQRLEKSISTQLAHPVETYLRVIGELLRAPGAITPDNVSQHIDHLQTIRRWIWDQIGHQLDKSPALLRIWCALDFAFATVRGMLSDRVILFSGQTLQLDFSAINDYDFTEWLVLHGADKALIAGFPAVRSMYDGPFAFFRGAVSTPNVEAGTALNIFLRLGFSSKEHIMWRMQAGMGDTVFAPAYLLLKNKFPDNVHFQFFHKATNLTLSEDKRTVVAIELEQQVKLAEGVTEYDPLVMVKGLPCWPSEPLLDQINPQQANQLRTKKIDLGSDWTPWTGETVRKKLGEDYDEVIIGASLASLPNFCCELIESNPKWVQMLDQVGTVQTQAFQLWLTKTPAELGVDAQKVLSCYVEPLDTFAVMNQVLAREDWSAFPDPPKSLIYVCGAMLDAETIPPFKAAYFPSSQRDEVYQNMKNYVLQNLQHVIPKAFDAENKFDWTILFDPLDGKGEERLKNQYFRANIDTSERYVFSLKGSSKYRLGTHESGFSNVYLTGDWIQNGMNIGFVEGAVISGIQTAQAVTNRQIPVYTPW